MVRMYAWIMVGSGLCCVVRGVLTLSDRGNATDVRTRRAGRGWVAMGGGFVLNGGSALLGFSSGTRVSLSFVALALIVLGGVFMVSGGASSQARRLGRSGRP
ncbi:hypothetical protein GCM10025734_62610 [Kitasatospora paranensis]